MCPRYAHGKDLKIFPDFKEDYVNLKKIKSLKNRKKALIKLKSTQYIKCCDYCDYPFREVITTKDNVN